MFLILTSEMPETLDKVIFSYDNIDLDCTNLDIIIFFSHNRDMNIVYLNNINFGNNDYNDPETMTHARLVA